MTIFVGVDPGANGAIAVLKDANTIFRLFDLPIDHVMINKKERSRLNPGKTLALFRTLDQVRDPLHVLIEHPTIRPLQTRDKQTGARVMRQPGAAGMFSFGENYGILLCALTAAGLPFTEVSPATWMSGVGVHGKDDARRLAAQWFPVHANYFSHKKDDGRADATLLALWGLRRAQCS